ncbi:hypothetical protein OAB25_03375 [Candidatus Pelagibacter sp.]|jgi:hypothetical protein|nr:hypothetical protein [Candidatus Pelagibacter sp.]
MKYQSVSKFQDMEYIIRGVGIVMLLFLAYCAIAIPYYYIKKIYFKTKGIKKSVSNFI